MSEIFTLRLERVRAGDRQALEELFTKWRPLLHLHARRLIGRELAARIDASDVLQTALMQAYQCLADFRGTTEGEWVTWLRRLITGHAAKSVRFHAADKRNAQRDRPLGDLPAPRPLASMGQQGEIDQFARLAAAIEQLPTDMHDVVVCRVFNREPFDQVANALGRSPGATRALWTRSLRRLRQLLGEH